MFSQESDGGKNVSLAHIDELIEKTDYNAALDEISRYIAEYPDDFDLAQKRVNRILKNRRDYNELARHLLEVLETGEDGEEKSLRVLEIVAQLESLEKNPTDKNIAFIRQAKVAAQFTVYRSRYFAIMTEGSDLVKNQQYVEGGRRFQDGFVLYRQEFDAEPYPASFKKPVYAALSDISTAYAAFAIAIRDCDLASEAYVQAVRAENLDAARKAFPALQKAFASYANLRNRIASSGGLFKKQFESLRESDPYLPDASFLGFAWRFVLGRATDPDSGVVGAMDAYWNSRLESLKNLMFETVLSEMQKSVAVKKSDYFKSAENYASCRSFIPLVKGFSSLAGDLQGFYDLLKDPDASPAFPAHSYSTSMAYSRSFCDALSASYTAMQDMYAAKGLRDADTKNQAGRDSPEAYWESVFKAVVRYEGIYTESKEHEALLLSEIAREKDAGRAEKESGTGRTSAGLQLYDLPLDFSSVNQSFLGMNQALADEAKKGAGLLWSNLALGYAEGAIRRLEDYSDRHAKYIALCDGGQEGETGKKYPSRVITLSQTLSSEIEKSCSLLSGWRANLQGGEAYRSSQPSYAKGCGEVDRVISELEKLLIEGTALIARAQLQVQNAERAANEAKLRYNEALAALKKGDFERARDLLQRSRSKYNESLSLQEDENLRASSDSQLVALGSDIAEKENEIVVRDVRALKKQARDAYYAGNFEEADNRLVQAKNRWAMTNVEEDKEISNLQALVTTALSMKTGRIIPPTAPLYPEMSQILSIANQYYSEGAALMKEGKKSEAKNTLGTAKEKLRSLLLVYPFNQEASLLNLRIDQLIDGKEFNAAFAQKLAAAKKDYKDVKSRQRAYADLLDLHEINPQYPGLKQLIYDVEIEIGIRPKPVDRSGLVKSKNLTEQAQKIYGSAGRNEAKLRSALSLVDEAISLNPDNDDAILLKDRIQIAVGGKATVVLSSADEAQYQQAIQAFQRGNVVGALALVDGLLQKSTNRRSAKILDLQKRLKEML